MTDTQRRLLVLAVCSQAAISICSWGLGALGPELRERFGISAAALGALLACGMLGNAAILIPAGTLVDRIGPRRPLIAGGLASGALLVLAGLAAHPLAMGAALFGFGIAAAFVAVAGQVSVFHGFDPSRRGLALGMRQMAVSAGGLVAAGLLPGLAALSGIRAALIAAGVLAATFSTLFGLASPPGRLAEGPPRRGMDLMGLLRIPGIPRLTAISVVHVSALAAVLNFSVPALRDAGASPQLGASLFAVVSVSAMLARIQWGRIADRNGGTRRRATLRDVGIVTLVGSLLYWAATPLGPPAQLPVMLVLAFGAMGANGLIYLLGGELAGPQRAGQATGLLSMALFGGVAVSSVPLGFLADHAGFTALWPVCAGLACLSILLTLGLPADRRHVERSDAEVA